MITIKGMFVKNEFVFFSIIIIILLDKCRFWLFPHRIAYQLNLVVNSSSKYTITSSQSVF